MEKTKEDAVVVLLEAGWSFGEVVRLFKANPTSMDYQITNVFNAPTQMDMMYEQRLKEMLKDKPKDCDFHHW